MACFSVSPISAAQTGTAQFSLSSLNPALEGPPSKLAWAGIFSVVLDALPSLRAQLSHRNHVPAILRIVGSVGDHRDRSVSRIQGLIEKQPPNAHRTLGNHVKIPIF